MKASAFGARLGYCARCRFCGGEMMGDKVISWLWAKMPGLIEWAVEG